MREIKFRGKRIDNGEWVFGYVQFSEDKKSAWICKSKEDDWTVKEQFPVIPETVDQFTGVHDDEYENELYGGDVIEMDYQEEKIICTVQHCGGGFILASDDLEDGFIWASDVTENDRQFFWIPTAVKIGNMVDDGERFIA